MEVQAIEALDRHLASLGRDTLSLTNGSWAMAPYRGGFIFSLTTNGSKEHFMVVDGRVEVFVPRLQEANL